MYISIEENKYIEIVEDSIRINKYKIGKWNQLQDPDGYWQQRCLISATSWFTLATSHTPQQLSAKAKIKYKIEMHAVLIYFDCIHL